MVELYGLDQMKEYLKKAPKIVMLHSVLDKHIDEAIISYLKFFTNRKTPITYITFEDHSKSLKQKFEHENINTDLMIFIDAITKKHAAINYTTRNQLYIDGPTALTDVAVALYGAIDLMKDPDLKPGIVIIDSLDMVSFYNPNENIPKFIHYLSSIARSNNLNELIIYKGSKKQDNYRQVVSTCDFTKEVYKFFYRNP